MSIDILIPTLHRAGKLAALAANIHDATSVEHTIIFVAESHDQATQQTAGGIKGARLLIGQYGSCAAAMNAGYRAGVGEFAFTANDDLRFRHGWDTAAIARMDIDTHIVGTNDGHGRMTCFAMARRRYIEQCSGVYDRPNQLWHEYISQYPDTELADYAKHRGVWGEAPDSITHHLHWEFGEADRDHPNYVKARETCGQDASVYTQRRAAWEAL